jgi:hypothetical protein
MAPKPNSAGKFWGCAALAPISGIAGMIERGRVLAAPGGVADQ